MKSEVTKETENITKTIHDDPKSDFSI